jgi:hypothetical protein
MFTWVPLTVAAHRVPFDGGHRWWVAGLVCILLNGLLNTLLFFWHNQFSLRCRVSRLADVNQYHVDFRDRVSTHTLTLQSTATLQSETLQDVAIHVLDYDAALLGVSMDASADGSWQTSPHLTLPVDPSRGRDASQNTDAESLRHVTTVL